MLYIWVRSTADWADESSVMDQLPAHLRAKVALWNATFDMPFHAFRHRVREIARINLSKVEDSLCATWEDIPEGALVVPVDDDDWFAPDIASVLEAEHEPGAAGYHWTSTWLEVPATLGHRLYILRRTLFPSSAPKWICTTNNYALVKADGAHELLRSHIGASRWVASRGRREVKRIDRRLSVANRTLGSQTTLRPDRPSISRRLLLRKLERHTALYRDPGTAHPPWCRPYVAMMAELMDEVGVRR